MTSPLRKSHPIIKIINNAIIDLPTSNNLSYMWSFGSLAGLCLTIQIITGLLLAMHYTPNVDIAFSSIMSITRNVNYGWLMRAIHANMASFFFICLYIHIGRGLYYSSFMMHEVWNIGVVLLIMTMAAAFMGYVLVWGQMSFWGATVITNLLSAIPYIGHYVVEWLWGGFSVNNATLNRFFSLHFFIPFIIAAMAMIHLAFLHQTGSNNPLGITENKYKIPFHWYFTSKDLIGFLIIFFLLSLFVLLAPDTLGDPENYIPADPLVTPVHIKPEWYFLWAYAILRSIPNKLGGVLAMFSALLMLTIMSLTYKGGKKGMQFCPPAQVIFWIHITNVMLLTWIGGSPVEAPYDSLGQLFTIIYFLYPLLMSTAMYSWEKIIH